MAGIHTCWLLGYIKDILKMMNLFTDRLIFFCRRQISGREESFCVIPEDSTCDGSENCSPGSFSEFQFLGRRIKRFYGHADAFSPTFRRISLKIFLGLCVSQEFIDASWEKLCFPHSLPFSRVIVGEERSFWCIRFEWRRSFWLTWLVLLLKR